jgi:hypothetical protein
MQSRIELIEVFFEQHEVRLFLNADTGRAMAQVISHRLLTVEAQVRARVNPCGIVVDRVALGQVFLLVFLCFPVNISFHHRSPNSYHLGNA